MSKANCEICPLGAHWKATGDFSPVIGEGPTAPKVVILGEAPGTHEVLSGRPLVGPGGRELQEALDNIQIARGDVHITDVIGCRPPDGKLSNFLLRLSRKNKKLVQANKLTHPTPQLCCRPRVTDELQYADKIICLGSTAAAAIRGGNPSIMGLRGACEELEYQGRTVKVAYSLHPDFVQVVPKWRPVFQRDIAKAFRFFSGTLAWSDPRILFVTNSDMLRDGFRALLRSHKPIAYDVETDAKNPLSAELRCLAFANAKLSVVVPLLSIDGTTRFFSPGEEARIVAMTKEFLLKAPLIGHNAGQYDRLVCEQRLGVTPNLRADTLLLHLLTDNEMPHNLGFVTSYYTDFSEAWKADHTAVTARSDEELHTYCAKDACATAHIGTALAAQVKSRNQWHLLDVEHTLQRIGCGMQRLGMKVDRDALETHASDFEVRLSENRRICAEIAPADFNPNSTLQLRKLLFNEWGLAPVKYNEKTGDPSTDDETLRRLITSYGLTPERIALVQSVRLIRRYVKLLSTYIRPLRSGLLMADGRIHPAYNRLPATGRYSSSEPNAQNIPAFLRNIFVPEEGHVFVGADFDQLELRLIAEETKAMRLVDIINSGLDPHNETMEAVYGKSVWSLDGAPDDRKKKGKGTFKKTRGITKTIRYAWQYAAGVPTVHEKVVSVEDESGKLIYANMSHKDVRDVMAGLRKADPEIPAWWNGVRHLYRRQHFIADSIWGRRRDFRGEEKINEMVNHPIQAGGAAIVHESMLELLTGKPGKASSSKLEDFTPVPFEFDKKLGLVNQCHDSLLFEVPEDKGEEVARRVEQAMTRRRREGALLSYTAEAAIANNWLEA